MTLNEPATGTSVGHLNSMALVQLPWSAMCLE
jgi:hypothetical protein